MVDNSDDYDPLDATALVRIAAILEVEPAEIGYLIHAASALYRSETAKIRQSAGRGTKLNLKRLAGQIKSAADALEAAPLQTILFADILETQRSGQHSRLLKRRSSVEKELRWMQNIFEDAASRRRGAIPELDIPMDFALGMLGIAYRNATGKAPTHSTHQDGEYRGRPLSTFGRFVVAFFGEIDPSLTERSIASSIRKRMPSLRADS